MSDLDEAITYLRESIEDDGFHPEIIKIIAEDWSLNPELLERKFTEQVGFAPSEYAPENRQKTRIRNCRIVAAKMRRNFGEAALVIEDPEAEGGYLDIHGLAIKTPARNEYVVVAKSGKDILAIPLIALRTGNPIDRLPIGLVFNGKPGLLQALHAGSAPEEPLWDFAGWLKAKKEDTP